MEKKIEGTKKFTLTDNKNGVRGAAGKKLERKKND